MKYNPEKKTEKGLRLCVNKSDFDAIVNKTKNKLYRSVTDDTVKKYIKHEIVDGVEYFSYNHHMINEVYFNLYGINFIVIKMASSYLFQRCKVFSFS